MFGELLDTTWLDNHFRCGLGGSTIQRIQKGVLIHSPLGDTELSTSYTWDDGRSLAQVKVGECGNDHSKMLVKVHLSVFHVLFRGFGENLNKLRR